MLNNWVLQLLADADVGRPQWMTNSFPIIQGVIIALISLISIIMVIAILVSPPETGGGNNAITGFSESYYAKNRSRSNQGRIRILIIVCGVTIAVLTIVFFILYGIFNMSGAN